MALVGERKRYPGGKFPRFEHLEENGHFFQFGLRFNGNEIGSGRFEGIKSYSVKFSVGVVGEMVAAGVFRTVGEVGAVGADGAGNKKRPVWVISLVGVPRFTSERDGKTNEARGFGFIDFRVGKTRSRCLLARGDGYVGTGFKILRMYGTDFFRVIRQNAGAPEAVV